MTNGVLDVAAQNAAATEHLWTTWIQMGFAGFSLILIALVCWLVRGILKDKRQEQQVLMALNGSIVQNTEVTRSLSESIAGLTQTVQQMKPASPMRVPYQVAKAS